MEKKLMLLIFVGILIIGIVSSVGEFTYCCEKTKDNFWCQNEEDPNNCQTGGGENKNRRKGSNVTRVIFFRNTKTAMESI